MGVPGKNKKCVCERNENNEMICGSTCVNAGMVCKTVKECNKTGPIRPKKHTIKRSSIQQAGGKTRKFSYNKMSNLMAKQKAVEIGRLYGKPDIIENDSSGNILSVTWKDIEGHKFVTVHNQVFKKYHPYPANVFVVTKRLIHVPEHLLGPLKYASETINIEQIRAHSAENMKYYKKGIKGRSLVSGSCASITISAITLKFVEDMCKKYKDPKQVPNPLKLYKEFRKEYDQRVKDYIDGKGIKPPISWYPNKLEKN